MTKATEQFFATLPARAPEVLRAPVAGTLRIDLSDGHCTDHWLVRMRPGAAEVDRGPEPSDATWYCGTELFDRLVTGRAQTIAAVLRNESTFRGNVVLLLAFRRFFPSAPSTRDPREVAREHARWTR
ncbi:SCP2 sterol-binding domain-containing protein [Micromonospora sp. DT48]|uniref:SCP2 sterol-binding domain-containing protein n=1 Tax=unclassified Micromonospora TaxID=2617518 RepID=UPI00132A653E|nr:SCP2 sterol-binding domain-containing protein [Micromonospora sp. CP22]MTK00627.1 SCP2 sterol-binding domain-containing protein [Micromonospora sp. CP22]